MNLIRLFNLILENPLFVPHHTSLTTCSWVQTRTFLGRYRIRIHRKVQKENKYLRRMLAAALSEVVSSFKTPNCPYSQAVCSMHPGMLEGLDPCDAVCRSHMLFHQSNVRFVSWLVQLLHHRQEKPRHEDEVQASKLSFFVVAFNDCLRITDKP